MQVTELSEKQKPFSYQFRWFDWFCLYYPPAWLVLFNRHWQHYKPDPNGWRWSEYILFLLPGGFYLAIVIRWLRLFLREFFQSANSVSPNLETAASNYTSNEEYRRVFRAEILTPIVSHYFRAKLHQQSYLPQTGPLIITLNHAGMCFPWDFLSLVWLLSEQRNWFVQPLAHPLFFDHPWLKWWLPQGWAESLGGVRAETADFEAAIAQDGIIIYAPEGWRGLAKGWQQRYRLAKFDPSFVRLSVRYQVPILPILCMGSERLHPWAFNARRVARLVKMPMFPISPLIPLFALFPSMGIWAVRSRLDYYLQPIWRPWEDTTLQLNTSSQRAQAFQQAQILRSRLQTAIEALMSASQENQAR